MPADVITGLNERGADAARELDEFDMNDHRWIRYRVAMSELDDLVSGLAEKWSGADVEGVPLRDMLVPGFEHRSYAPRSQKWTTEDREATEKLVALATEWADLGNPAMDAPPRPNPDLRLTPRL